MEIVNDAPVMRTVPRDAAQHVADGLVGLGFSVRLDPCEEGVVVTVLSQSDQFTDPGGLIDWWINP